jgi:AAA ATPase domain
MGGPVRAWAALRPALVESRFEALHANGLTELVGREEELELLLRRWSKTKAGEGQAVLLSGEAGIGKSRLTAALLETIASEPHTRLRYFCSPQHTDSAFYPIIGQIGRAAGLTHEDTSQARLDKLDALLAQTSTSRQDAALIAEMLSLPNDGRYSSLEPTPEQRRQRTLEALILQMQALARSKPRQSTLCCPFLCRACPARRYPRCIHLSWSRPPHALRGALLRHPEVITVVSQHGRPEPP